MKVKKKIIYYLIEILFTLITSLFLYLIVTDNFVLSIYDKNLFILLELVLICGIWLLGPMLNRIYALFYLGIIYIYIISQVIYNSAFHTYYRISMALTLRNEVAGVGDSVAEFLKFEYFVPLIFLVVFILIFVVLYIFFQRKTVCLIERIILICISVLVFVPFGKKLYGDFEGLISEVEAKSNPFNLIESDYYYYLKFNNNKVFVEKFGILTFLHRDCESFFNEENISEDDFLDVEEFLNNKQEHMNNEYTGIFENKNVLFIQAESFMDIAVNKILTPNIYMLKENGIEIVNFDAPATPGSTSDSEFAANTAIIPNSGGQTGCYLYENNTFPTTLPKIFSDNGYATSLYHNSFGNFYNRNVFLKNLGYDELLFCSDFGENVDLPDTVLGKTLSWIVNADYKYMGYWITFSGHQPYNYNSVGVNEEDINKIKSIYPDLDESYVSYLAKQMDLDHAIGDILNVLRMTNTLDNTVIVFFGDHVVKGLDFSAGSSFYQQTGIEYNDNDVYTSLYFYNSEVTPAKYEKNATLIDLLPTIANMWNFEVDSKTFLGRDIFDNDYNGFKYSEWGAWSTDDCYYDLAYDIYQLKEGTTKTIDEVREEMTYYKKMKDISVKILDLDYFKNEGEK